MSATAEKRRAKERDNDRRGGGNFFMQYMLQQLFQSVFMVLGFLVVAKFSRWREFRADAGGARLAGRGNMIDALKALERLHDPEIALAEARQSQGFSSLKIAGPTRGVLALLMDHPPLEERIARLEAGTV